MTDAGLPEDRDDTRLEPHRVLQPIAPEPISDTRLGLGVALDMPWHGGGFQAGGAGGDYLPASLVNFFRRYGREFEYSLIAFQPRNFSRLRVSDYVDAYDQFYLSAGTATRSFHQTSLNLGSPEPYDRSQVIAFTNALSERYEFGWVVEDLAIWSLRGKSLPYPLPPLLTNAGIDHCVRNIQETQRKLTVPLHVEFPGFTEGASFTIGPHNALEAFSEVAARSDCWVTLDVGHILGYLALTSRSQSDIEDLPLGRCRELHLAGCSFFRGRFQDMHHGVLIDEQIDLTAELLKRCPNLVAITYEDPRFRQDGTLPTRAVRNFERLGDMAREWAHGVDQ